MQENSAEGVVSFNITAFDLAGNSLTVNQTQLNSPNITIDHTNPQLVNLTVYSDHSNMSLARIGNFVNMTLHVTESLQSATIGILNNTMNMSVVNDIAHATILVLQNSSNGPLEFNITAYDKAGNILSVTQDNIAEKNVVIDTIDPSLVNLTIYSNNAKPSFAKANDSVTITLTTKEPIGNITITALNQSISANINGTIATASILVDQSTTNGLIKFSIKIIDTSNGAFNATFNQRNLKTANVFVDTTVPVIELSLGKNSIKDLDGNVGDRIEINNKYVDPGSRIVDNDPTYDGPVSTTSNVNESVAGIYHVKYNATDNAGNIAQSVYRTVSVLSSNDSVDVKLPLSNTNPVIYSNNTQLNVAKWTNDKSITFVHNFTQIIQKAIIIKIANNTMLSTLNDHITNANFSIIPIHVYSNSNISGVFIGHDDISYDISSAPIMIAFLNVHDPSAVPFYSDDAQNTSEITFYNESTILNSSDANRILSSNVKYEDGTLYTKKGKNITIWTNHLTYFGINSTLGVTPTASTKSDAPGSPPTMGLANSGVRIVEEGFDYNGVTVNVNRYYTEFPQISTNVGDLNSLKMKFYDNAGPEGIKRVEVALGVPDIGLYHDAESLIEIWMDRNNLTVQDIIILDELNLLETSSISASLSKTSCNDYDETECLLVDLKYSYKESPAYEIIAIKPVDWDNNAFQFYFNDGIRVHGNSLNIPKEIVISTSHAAFPNQNQEQLSNSS